jgi:serine/threonine protein kinase
MPVAIKITRPSPDIPVSVIREMKILRELRHPCLVPLLDVCVDRMAQQIHLVYALGKYTPCSLCVCAMYVPHTQHKGI